jgi:hypothetical protein
VVVNHSPPPQAAALLLADQIYRDPGTNKHFILGTYNAVSSPAYPCLRPSLSVYAALTGGRGRVPIRLVLTDADEELGPLAQAEGAAEMPDPLQNWEIVFHLNDVVLPRPGQYRLQLFACGELLRELRLHALLTAATPPGGGAGGRGSCGVEEWERDDTEC